MNDNASQIIDKSTTCSTTCSGLQQRKHQSYTLRPFHGDDFLNKRLEIRKEFQCHDNIMSAGTLWKFMACEIMMTMTSSNGNIFRVTGHLCGEFTGIPRTKASDAELWCFSLICVLINGWVNNREAGDLRRHRVHYDVTVMNGKWNLRILSHCKKLQGQQPIPNNSTSATFLNAFPFAQSSFMKHASISKFDTRLP